MSYTKKVRSMYKRQPNTLVVLAFKNGSRDQPARVAAPNLRMVIYYMCLIHHTHFNFTPKIFYLELQGRLHHSSSHYPWHSTASTICRHVNSTCDDTPHSSWRSFISGGCCTSMEHSSATGSGCAFSSCLSTGTEDCAVPVVLSGWLTICFVLSTSDELSPAWLLTLTESDCTVVLQQKCDNATLIIFISILLLLLLLLLLRRPQNGLRQKLFKTTNVEVVQHAEKCCTVNYQAFSSTERYKKFIGWNDHCDYLQ